MQVIPEINDTIETTKGNRFKINDVLKSDKAVLVEMQPIDERDKYAYPVFVKFEDFKIIAKG